MYRNKEEPMMGQNNEQRRQSFDSSADAYDRARPSYPEEVIDWIVENTGITVDDALLEIGPGTGQATMRFAERGFAVRCVELGEKLAARLREKTQAYRVAVDVAPFEAWEAPDGLHPRMIYCATAFHWLDPAVAYPKCYGLLPDDRALVLLWNAPGGAPNEAIVEAYRLIGIDVPRGEAAWVAHEQTIARQKAAIAGSGLFEVTGLLDHVWFPPTDKANFIDGFFTQSTFLSMPEAQQDEARGQITALLEAMDESIASPFYTTVYIAHKRKMK